MVPAQGRLMDLLADHMQDMTLDVESPQGNISDCVSHEFDSRWVLPRKAAATWCLEALQKLPATFGLTSCTVCDLSLLVMTRSGGSVLSLEQRVMVFATPDVPCTEMPLNLKRFAWLSHLLSSIKLWLQQEPCWAPLRHKLILSVKSSERMFFLCYRSRWCKWFCYKCASAVKTRLWQEDTAWCTSNEQGAGKPCSCRACCPGRLSGADWLCCDVAHTRLLWYLISITFPCWLSWSPPCSHFSCPPPAPCCTGLGSG